jgi:hypothetical protein
MAGGYDDDARRRNLQRANKVRVAQAQLRERLAAGDVDPYQLVAGDDEKWEQVARRMPLGRLLPLIRGMGPVSAKEALAELGVDGEKKLDALTYERRRALADLLRSALDPNTELEVPEV